jgi:hypothetical protein
MDRAIRRQRTERIKNNRRKFWLNVEHKQYVWGVNIFIARYSCNSLRLEKRLTNLDKWYYDTPKYFKKQKPEQHSYWKEYNATRKQKLSYLDYLDQLEELSLAYLDYLDGLNDY